MKKATIEAVLTVLETRVGLCDELVQEVTEEVRAELSKGQVRKEATATAYAEMWEAVRQALEDATAPVTAQEIANETGLSRGKIVYGLAHIWADEVEKDTSGKTTTYALKA